MKWDKYTRYYNFYFNTNPYLMTRINLIPVKELTDQHLLSEHREIKRIPNIINSWKYDLNWIPEKFTLWKGHVKFFYNKMLFLLPRYIELYRECQKRWFKVCYYLDSFGSLLLAGWLSNDYNPTPEDIQISRDRIQEKIRSKPWFYRYYWKIIN